MARLHDRTCALCRRETKKLFLKGEKCDSQKCPVSKRPYPPGAHGLSRRSRPSDYAMALREKQRVKRIYGILEKQFRNYFKKADRKQGITGEILLQLLEMRLDVIVYRMGFADSLRQSRQLVNHGHFTVNGKKVDIPSYQVKIKDKIEVKAKSKESIFFENIKSSKIDAVSWVMSDLKNLKGEVLNIPMREDLDPGIEEQLIVELYSK